MDALEALLTRRSIRAYTDEPVSDAHLRQVLECALYAPTSSNSQCSRFLVIRSRETLTALNAAVCAWLREQPEREGQVMNVGIRAAQKEGMDFFYGAPVLITAVAPRDYANSMASCAAGLENALLAAHALGLGGCWGNQAHWLSDIPSVRCFFERLGLREDEAIFGSVEIGHPARVSTRERPRKEGRLSLDLPLT